MSKKWWQFWKSDDFSDISSEDIVETDFESRSNIEKGRIKVNGYAVSSGSQLHQLAEELMGVDSPLLLDGDVNVNLPQGNLIDQLVEEWATLGRGVNTEKKKQAMRLREQEIGEKLNEMGGIDLMRAFAYRLIYEGRSYESDFSPWHGIGEWQN